MLLNDLSDCNLHLGIVDVGKVPCKQVINAVASCQRDVQGIFDLISIYLYGWDHLSQGTLPTSLHLRRFEALAIR